MMLNKTSLSTPFEEFTYRHRVCNAFIEGVGSVKKPIFKSVSVTPKASSPSGTSAKTAVTASKSLPKPASKLDSILARAKKRTPAQSRLVLIRAGIITEDGKLTAKYKVKSKAKKQSVEA